MAPKVLYIYSKKVKSLGTFIKLDWLVSTSSLQTFQSIDDVSFDLNWGFTSIYNSLYYSLRTLLDYYRGVSLLNKS